MDFEADFQALTNNPPFPWQSKLFECFIKGTGFIPERCDIPTGLGKTSVIAIWLLARESCPSLPRRLVYVVNRRTVVDQTTTEVEKLRTNLKKLWPERPELAISTLRGQFADNREWSVDPSREAVICGTVDMIGSRLLFNGYGVGFKSRPLHAGFLGQDALIVHDEAHLEPAFQKLIEEIAREQERELANHGRERPLWSSFRVMELTATGRGKGEPFKLSDEDKENETVKKRIYAKKKLHLKPLDDVKKLAEKLAAKALEFKDKNRAVLVFARTVEAVMKIRDVLAKAKLSVETLTGTMRGKERDGLVAKEIFKRFLPGGQSDSKTAYLVCTSAGEVGVNISADDLVCDLSTFESMAQRFGRVNRFGNHTDTEIHVLHSTENNDTDYQRRLENTLELLRELEGNASPAALGELDAERRVAAFAPPPILLPTSDILFDAWPLTTIRGKLPGRPEVEPYLHGLPTEWQPPETYVAWRREVSEVAGVMLAEYALAELLSEYPLKPYEMLREPSYRAAKEFEKLAEQHKETKIPVWLLDDNGSVAVLTLAELVDGDAKAKTERIAYKTVILPPVAGGLEGGMLSGSSSNADDVADEWFLKNEKGEQVRQRKRIWNDKWDDETDLMHEVVMIRFPGSESDEDTEEKIWRWLRRNNEGDRSAKKPVRWDVHVGDVERETAKIVYALPLGDGLKNALKQAAKYHDHGKQRALFQRVLGNANPNILLAKSGKKTSGLPETYRHEFGSLLDIEKELESLELGEHQDLVLHLIAAHHGRARPHFPSEEVFDPERSQSDAERIASEVPRRFARLQRQYGRWGLAYLESLLRAGDWAASASPSEYYEGGNS